MPTHALKNTFAWMPNLHRRQLIIAMFMSISLVSLAWPPLVWLIRTWLQPEYDSVGAAVFGLVVLLMGISLKSGPPEVQLSRETGTTTAWLGMNIYVWLLVISALLRALSQLLAINIIGAGLLVVDLYAFARLLQVAQRPFGVRPGWLALLFCFTLPIEPIVQRLLGFPLQHLAAHVAYGLLFPFEENLVLHGVRLLINDVDVLVDLPCSGSKLLSTLSIAWCAMHCISPHTSGLDEQVLPNRAGALPRFLGSVFFLLLVAIVANGVRVALLAAGLAYASLTGVDVMQPIPHQMVGLLVQTIAIVVLFKRPFRNFTFSRAAVFCDRQRLHKTAGERDGRDRSEEGKEGKYRQEQDKGKGDVNRKISLPRFSLTWAVLLACLALLVSAIQPQPVDASPSLSLPPVPAVAAGFFAHELPLSDLEERYFQAFGGNARRVAYGPFSLLLVSTQSPLRHLHDPLVCLRGMGMQVQFLGTDFGQKRSVYQVYDPVEDRSYHIYVRYLGADMVALNIAQVVWVWMQRWVAGQSTTWIMEQQIVPLEWVGNRQAETFSQVIHRLNDVGTVLEPNAGPTRI